MSIKRGRNRRHRQPDIGLAFVVEKLELLQNDVQRLSLTVDTLIAEGRTNAAQASEDREILSEGLAIFKEDMDWFSGFALSAIQRNSDKLSVLVRALSETDSARAAGSSKEETVMTMRPLRALPEIKRGK